MIWAPEYPWFLNDYLMMYEYRQFDIVKIRRLISFVLLGSYVYDVWLNINF